jgi:hypothetical protein
MKRRNKGIPPNTAAKHAVRNAASVASAIAACPPADIVERLRALAAAVVPSLSELLHAGADEIERLRKGESICIRCGQRQAAATDDHPKF